MDPDNWTYWGAWKVVLKKVGIRVGIVFVILGAGLYLALPDLQSEFFSMAMMLPIFFAVGSVAGVVIGFAVSRNLVEDSGLEGRSIVLPVVAMLLLAEFAASVAATLVRGGSVAFAVVPSSGVYLWSAAICIFKIMTAK